MVFLLAKSLVYTLLKIRTGFEVDWVGRVCQTPSQVKTLKLYFLVFISLCHCFTSNFIAL